LREASASTKTMSNEFILTALEDIHEKGYSLVLACGRWRFAKGPRLFPENPKIDEPLIKAGDLLRLGTWATPLAALTEYGRRITPRSIRPAPTGHPGIVKITKEQYEAMRAIIIEHAGDKQPFTATKSLALDGLMQMSYCFGATSSDHITLYPTIG
jgi:hypothetical protein